MAKKSRKGHGDSARPRPVYQAEVPALRARLAAAVAGGFVDVWRWLQRISIGRLFHYFLAQRGVEPTPSADHPGAIKIKAIWYDDGKKSKKPQQQQSPAPPLRPAPPPKPAPPLHVVDGIEVPLEQETQYREHCRRACNCHGRSSLCHICVFEKQPDHNSIVGNGGMIIHCNKYHRGTGLLVCEDMDCQVRFREGNHRDRRLHVYFFHELPRGWWLN